MKFSDGLILISGASLMGYAFWMDLHGLVDLFEKEQSCVFRFPKKKNKTRVSINSSHSSANRSDRVVELQTFFHNRKNTGVSNKIKA